VPNLVRGTALAAAVAAVCALGAAPAGAEKTQGPPKNAKGRPAITGEAVDGRVLEVSNGNWRGVTPITYTYEWERCGDGAGCVVIAGAEQQSYRVQTADIGHKIRAIVTATNSLGSASRNTKPTFKVAPGSPVNLELPSITGTVLPGETLTAHNGTWAGTPPITFEYNWWHCTGPAGCTFINGATGPTYTIQPTEAGDGYYVVVFASNKYGEEPANSPEVTPGGTGL
jgi:hypothetical protein